MHFLRSHSRQFLLVLALVAMGAILCALLLPIEHRSVAQQLVGFPDSDVPSQKARPWILVAMCFLPALAGIAYAFGNTLDRYITRRFLGMLAICFFSLFAVWLLINLTDNLPDFLETKRPLRTAAIFYGTLFPATVMLLLPYSLLLALLESLGKLSTNREIIAMIQSGRGVLRITLPLLCAGAFCTLLALGLNYHWAPVAEGREYEILAEASGQKASKATKVLYRNEDKNRLWMISAFPKDYEKGKPLLGVEVTTTNNHYGIESRLTASQAHWNRSTLQWTFDDAVVYRFEPGRPPELMPTDGPLTIDGWSETPWQIIKPGLSAPQLGIPELNAWLRSYASHAQTTDPSPYLTHWQYRWALPFTCLITVLLATPLAIHFARRGPGGGVFLAIVLSAIMLLTNTIILAFGEAGILKPALAAWLPNAVFASIGMYLYRRRITGKPIYQSLWKFLPSGSE